MPKLGRPRAEVIITDDERVALVRLTKRARVNRAVAFRARIVLACADAPDSAVARRLRTTKTTVAKWRRQFVERGLDGLYDEPRVGAPRTISDEQVEAIIVKTLETTPPGETHWSTRSMAKAAGVSHTMVGRIWRTFRLQPHRTESFKLSPDPQLVDKIRDVVGLYAIVSNHKSNSNNWLPTSISANWEPTSKTAREMGVFSNSVTLRICRSL